MCDPFHTALSGEAAGLKTPAASDRPLPSLGCVPVVTFKLFVHYSFIIRSSSLLFVHYANEAIQKTCYDISGRLLGLLGASWAVLGVSWCLLGASWRPLGELLGAFVAH